MARAHSHRNFGLDLLRCFAIGGVVFAHAMNFLYPYVPALPVGGGRNLHLYHFGHFGTLGVELFFVLSGFLIGGLLLRIGERLADGRELRQFYVRRWFRTLPNYYVFLALNFICFATWAQLPRYLVFLQNFTANRVSFFPESWSLSIEEWFYLLFPFAVWVLLRVRLAADWAFLTAGFAIYCLSTWLRMVYAAQPSNDWAPVLRVVTVLRFDALMTGILAAWLAARRPALFRSVPWLKALAGFGLLFFCYCTLYWYKAQNETFFARTFRFNLISLSFALMLPYAVTLGRETKSWWSVTVESLAKWSYAMYFVNVPLMYYAGHVLFKRTETSAAQAWWAFGVTTLGTILISAFWYELFERRTTALRDRFAPG